MSDSLHVLLVDDEPETLRLVRKILQADGYTVVEATDGQEALDAFHREHPDLILLDIIIPQIDGIEVLKRIRAEDTVTGIIMVSALTSEKLAVEAMQAGADDYVSKPFPLKEIRVRIQQTAAKARLRQENLRLRQQLQALQKQDTTSPAAFTANDSNLPERLTLQLDRQPREVTVLSVSLFGFERLDANTSTDALSQTLSQYLGSIAGAVDKEQGMLERITGDSAVALFNTLAPQPDHALRAARAALEIRQGMTSTGLGSSPSLLVPCISLHTGQAIVGKLGSHPLAIGEAVQRAQHLLHLAAPGDIIVSPQFYARLRDRIEIEPLRPADSARNSDMAEALRLHRLIA